MNTRLLCKAVRVEFRRGIGTTVSVAGDTNFSDDLLLKSAEPKVAHRIRVHGLLISVENPKGSLRSKMGGDGKRWERRMFADYGRIVGKRGADGDQVDCYVGRLHTAPNAYVISQVNKDGKFDEYKCVMGVRSKEDAQRLYLKHYPKGWKIGHIEEMPFEQFREWLDSGGATGESCPHCGAVMEHGDDGKCNRCGKDWKGKQ